MCGGLGDAVLLADWEDVIYTSLGPESRRVVPWSMASSWSAGEPPSGPSFDILECCLLVFVREIYLDLDFDVPEAAGELPSWNTRACWAVLIVPRFACFGWSTRRLAPGCEMTRKAAGDGCEDRLVPVDII